MKKLVLIAASGLLLLTGCASNIQSLQRGTVESTGMQVAPNEVAISNVKRGAMNVNWTATTPKGEVYECSADDMVRKVICLH